MNDPVLDFVPCAKLSQQLQRLRLEEIYFILDFTAGPNCSKAK